jgi:hypothetical protein
MLLPALHDCLVLQQNQTTVLLFFQPQQHLCTHHQSIQPSITLLHLPVSDHQYLQQQPHIRSRASRTTNIPITAQTPHQHYHLDSIMHFFTALFSLFAATASAFPTKPGYLTQPVARDAGDVSLPFFPYNITIIIIHLPFPASSRIPLVTLLSTRTSI